MEDWTLEMALVGPYGERLTMCVKLDHGTATEICKIDPPGTFPSGLGLETFKTTVEILKRRQYRKDLFIDAARNLGALLAERMEDAEGWHDTSRIEPAKAQLSGCKDPAQ